MPSAVAQCLQRLFQPSSRTAMLSAVRFRQPWLCDARIEDALQDSGVEFLHRPAPMERALAKGGDSEARRLLIIAARRKASRARSRGHGRFEVLPERSPEGTFSITAEQEVWLRERIAALPSLIADAASAVGGRQAATLAQAVWERLLVGESDAEVAARYGLPRETLNRAKRAVIKAASERDAMELLSSSRRARARRARRNNKHDA
ncbi:hypothetical protein L6R49_30915 [Myxococcota bacterium]|nr:hypothetical protein [Myxococcota bacterium]